MKKRRRVEPIEAEEFPPEQVAATSCVVDGRHQIEEDVQRELLAEPKLRFSSLVVRRVPDGVCLEGVLEADDAESATSCACGLARRVAGVREVLNHLVVCQGDCDPPAKG